MGSKQTHGLRDAGSNGSEALSPADACSDGVRGPCVSLTINSNRLHPLTSACTEIILKLTQRNI